MTSIGTPEQTENFLKYKEILKGKSAIYPEKGPPGTVILYNGKNEEDGRLNRNLAIECSRKLENTYTIHKTKAGNYMDMDIRDAKNSRQISESQHRELWDDASRMLVNQAKGPALAVTPDGVFEIGSTFLRVEMKEIMSGNTGITSINGVPVGGLKYEGLNQNGYGLVDLNVDTAKECKEQPAPEPSILQNIYHFDSMMALYLLKHPPKLPQMPDFELERMERGGGGKGFIAPLPVWQFIDNSPLNNQLHNQVANDPALAQQIASASANLKDSGVDLQQVGVSQATYARAEMAASKAAMIT